MLETSEPVIELAEAEALRARVGAGRLQDGDFALLERIISS